MYPNLILGFPVFFELIHVNLFMKSIAFAGKFSFFVKFRVNKNKLQIPLGIPFDRLCVIERMTAELCFQQLF